MATMFSSKGSQSFRKKVSEKDIKRVIRSRKSKDIIDQNEKGQKDQEKHYIGY